MLVLKNGTLIDGTGRAPVRNAAVVIEGNRIKDAGAGVKYPPAATAVDLKGMTVMPGLIDAHVHCGGIIDLKPDWPAFVGREESRDYAEVRESSIAAGVTSTRSVGDCFPDIVQVRDEIAAGRLNGPRIFTTGPLFTAPGGHPASTIMGECRPEIRESATRCLDDPQQAREEVKKLADGGVDYIKAILASLNIFDYPNTFPMLSRAVLEALTDEAHRHGLRVVVHAEDPATAMEAAEAGADSIEHILTTPAGPEMPDDLVRLLLERGTYVVPTLSIIAVSDGVLRGVPRRLEDLKKGVKKLYDAGVNISAGTDAGGPDCRWGEVLHMEMELMQSAGMSAMDVIVAATRNNAENLGHADELGTIEKGKLADVIVVEGDPLKNMADSRNVRLVVKDGSIMLDKMVSR
jgi:imidazolonepropionase-like amidohydrolase